MTKKSNLQLILLSQLNKQEMTGYDLSKYLEENGWPVSHQQVYRDLNILAERGYVSLQHVPQSGKPDKKVYSLAEPGLKLLENAVNAEPVLPKLRDEALVHLFMGNSQYFSRLMAVLVESIDELKVAKQGAEFTREAILDRLIARYEADAKWAQSVARQLSEMKLAA